MSEISWADLGKWAAFISSGLTFVVAAVEFLS